jgi:hypothetical protein
MPCDRRERISTVDPCCGRAFKFKLASKFGSMSIVRRVRPTDDGIVRHLRDRVVGPWQPELKKEGGGRPESQAAFEGLKGNIQPSCTYSHRRVSPISRFAANRDPDSRFPAESGNGPFSDSRFGDRPIGNREFPTRFPAKSGIGGTGIGDFRVRGSAPPTPTANSESLGRGAFNATISPLRTVPDVPGVTLGNSRTLARA